jgi:Carboxypeptidase regulatory-like domain
MPNLHVAWSVLFLLAVTATPAGAQVVVNETRITGDAMQLPGMPGRPEFKTGTGRIRGRIVAADTGTPVRRAQIRLTGPEVGSKAALTDAEGRFEFIELPAGRFTVSASKSGFVTLQYGQSRPFESGKTIELAEAQQLDKADIALPRGSVIAGRLLDEFGDPVPDATVSALRSTWSNGRRRLQSAGRSAQTNDLGQFRLFGLPPGEYYVSASATGGQMMQVEMAVSATMAGSSGASGSSPTSGYAPTYFPGTTNGSEAQRVTLAVGQEAQNTDFALVPVKLAKVSGIVLNSEGAAAEGTMVNAVPRSADTEGHPLFGIGLSGRTDKNGAFTIRNVPPGEYTLQTRAVQVFSRGDGGRAMVFTVRGPGGGNDGAEVGSVPLSVSGNDVNNVVVVTSKGGTATGTLIYEGGAKPDGRNPVRITASAFDADGPAMPSGSSTPVKDDDTFELGGLSGGRVIRAGNLPSGWTLKSVRLNGRDITDTGAEFKAGEAVSGLEVVLTNKLTQVSGLVKGADGEAVKDYTVVVFSDNQDLWTVPQSRYVAGVRPDQDGRFQFRNLPPGTYYAVAVEYVEQGAWGDPELLMRLKDKASTFSLDEGESKTLDLTMGVLGV